MVSALSGVTFKKWFIKESMRYLFALLLVLIVVSSANGQEKQHSKSDETSSDSAVFATVDATEISLREFKMAVWQVARSRFYHGKVSTGKMAELQREVAQKLVDRIQLIKEAQRRRIEPDKDFVKKQIKIFDEKYANSEKWKKKREKLLPDLRKNLEKQSVLEKLEAQVRLKIRSLDESQIRKYYEENPGKFTEPERINILLILIKVDPSSPKESWDAAKKKGMGIVERLEAGESFEDLAREHSMDGSAASGGNLGYTHRGMLSTPVQEAVDRLKPGENSGPVVVLEGVAILKLKDRLEPRLMSFDSVKEKAGKYLAKKISEREWKKLIESLRAKSKVKINEQYYLPLDSKETEPDKTPEG